MVVLFSASQQKEETGKTFSLQSNSGERVLGCVPFDYSDLTLFLLCICLRQSSFYLHCGYFSYLDQKYERHRHSCYDFWFPFFRCSDDRKRGIL